MFFIFSTSKGNKKMETKINNYLKLDSYLENICQKASKKLNALSR